MAETADDRRKVVDPRALDSNSQPSSPLHSKMPPRSATDDWPEAPTRLSPALAADDSRTSAAVPEDASPDFGATPALARVESTVVVETQESTRVDMLLLLAKCAVPALFVAVGGAVAIPADGVLTEGMRVATEEMAGGALLVTYAFECVVARDSKPC